MPKAKPSRKTLAPLLPAGLGAVNLPEPLLGDSSHGNGPQRPGGGGGGNGGQADEEAVDESEGNGPSWPAAVMLLGDSSRGNGPRFPRIIRERSAARAPRFSLAAGRALGAIPEEADPRDFGVEHLAGGRDAASHLLRFHAEAGDHKKLPRRVSLAAPREWEPVFNQGPVACCTAEAIAAIAAWHCRRRKVRCPRLSRLHLFKLARLRFGLPAQGGATLRDTCRALARHGCLPEARWPYRPAWLEREPLVRDQYDAVSLPGWSYARLDAYDGSPDRTLDAVLHALADEMPVAFGLTIFRSVDDATAEAPWIPLPGRAEDGRVGAHALVAVGYDFAAPHPEGRRPALLVRNSWGDMWGDKGFAWLPFEFVRAQLAYDFWVLSPG